MKPTVTNVEVELSSLRGGSYSVSCEYGDARYHIWINSRTGKIESALGRGPAPCLYKRPLAGITPHAPGYYNTRQLRADSQFGAQLIGEMLAFAKANDLVTKAQDKLKAKEEADKEASRLWRRNNQIKEAAPELFDALKAFVDACPMCNSGQECQDDRCYAGRAAIAKAETCHA